jgi:hypothetical protein
VLRSLSLVIVAPIVAILALGGVATWVAWRGDGSHARSIDREPRPKWDDAALSKLCPADIPVVVDERRIDGRLAAEVVHCDAGAGSPPSMVVLLAADHAGRVRVEGIALEEKDQVQVSGLGLRSNVISAAGRTYSSDDVPRCCPDLQFARTWRWDGHTLTTLR